MYLWGMFFSMVAFNMRRLLHQLYVHLINLLSPPMCAYCKQYLKERALFCDSCDAKVQNVITMMLPITTTKSVKVFAASAYKEPIKTLIVAKSWSDNVASKHLADLIWQRTDLKSHPFDYLVPVPLHWSRFARRGFNQAEEIANTLADYSGKKVAPIVKRIRKTPFQSGLTPEQRTTNVHSSFALKTNDMAHYRGKHLVIVDDLLTTGATMRAVAHVLLPLKPASIAVVVASRVV